MSAETIKALDAAVQAHIADVLKEIPEVRPVVMSWVVATEVQTIEGDLLLWDNDYCTSETTSPNGALGLATWLADTLRDIRRTDDYDEEAEAEDDGA